MEDLDLTLNGEFKSRLCKEVVNALAPLPLSIQNQNEKTKQRKRALTQHPQFLRTKSDDDIKLLITFSLHLISVVCSEINVADLTLDPLLKKLLLPTLIQLEEKKNDFNILLSIILRISST